jgi:ABC-type bacteriocin/lantibiotic exporter with double-glycine peptidase domain
VLQGGMRGSVEFRGVSFAYPTRPRLQVLNGLNLQIPAGAHVAVVGASGGGKTTLMQLLLGFYRPQVSRASSHWSLSVDSRH